MKPLVIYHANCADGYGAAFAAWLVLGDEADYMPCQYGKQAEEFMTSLAFDREVYILDFSFPKNMMDEIFHRAKYVVWLDHHASAFEMWCGSMPDGGQYAQQTEDRFIFLDEHRSGAYLTWQWLHLDTEVPLFIKHIDDYDRWQFKLEGTKEINKALWSYTPWSFEQWDKFMLPFAEIDLRLVGEAILRAHNQNVQAVVKNNARKCRILKCSPKPSGEHWEAIIDVDATGLAANCPSHLTSDVGHELANQSGTFGLLWRIDKDNTCICSLRSNGDYDVSAIAKAFGGGGHKNAAGFTIDIQTLLAWTA